MWIPWLVLACVLAIGELHHQGFYLAPFSLAAFASAAASFLGAGTWLSFFVFILISIFSVVALKPIALRHRRLPARLRTGTAALVGHKAVVSKASSPISAALIRLDNGEVWSAKGYSDEELEQGEKVEVMQIEGATALVIKD
jgi:membrane protein implicated in regulation of membrane protease activity